MHLIEIFSSIQGESSHAGRPCVFVRLAGCNLRCHWCDTVYSFTGGKKWSLAEVLAEVERLQTEPGLVELTGGEPMLQAEEAIALMEALLASGREVLLETSGSLPLDKVPAAVYKIVDVKCPSSGEAGKFCMANLAALNPRDEIKFVIADRADYDYARNFCREHGLEALVGVLLLSPAFKKEAHGSRSTENCQLDPADLAAWIVEDRWLRARLSLQTHKFIWEPQLRGV